MVTSRRTGPDEDGKNIAEGTSTKLKKRIDRGGTLRRFVGSLSKGTTDTFHARKATMKILSPLSAAKLKKLDNPWCVRTVGSVSQ